MDYYYQPIYEHPGYYYNWIAPLQQWGMKWHPIKNTYCPPQFDNSMYWIHMSPPEGINMIPLLGDGNMHCEKLAQEIGATYIYYRQDLKKIEIWAQDITEAMTKMSIYLNKIKSQRSNKKPILNFNKK
jgi:hypothetical protein